MRAIAWRLLLLALALLCLAATWAAWTAPTGYPAPEEPPALPRAARPSTSGLSN